MRILLAALLFLAIPATATHVDAGEVRWACGFGGGHPDECGINPVGGGAAVQSVGPAVWSTDVWIQPDTEVLGITLDGNAWAVPVRLLDTHEIVNTNLAGRDVAITYCPLCGSGITFDSTITIDGRTEVAAFAASGYLFQNDLVMWDDQFDILWNQITGRPIGTLGDASVNDAHPDIQLTRIPTILTTWNGWLDEHPDSLLLQPARNGYSYPYGDYEASERRCGLGACTSDDTLHPKEFIIGIESGDGVAFSRFAVQASGGVAVHEGVVVAVDPNGAHRAWQTGGHNFTQDASGLWLDESGRFWDLSQGSAADGRETLPAVDGLVMFWFAWSEHHPDTTLWEPAEGPTGGLKVDNGELPGFTIPIVLGLLVGGGWLWRRQFSL